MATARAGLPENVGPQRVIEVITKLKPSIDTLLHAERFRRAWLGRAADPEFTVLVEEAADHYKKLKTKTAKRLSRQKLSTLKA